MLDNLSGVLEKISAFPGCSVVTDRIPDRDAMASTSRRWVRKQSDWRSEISDSLLERFNETNEQMLRKLDYLSEPLVQGKNGRQAGIDG
jgi:hypothetical protein